MKKREKNAQETVIAKQFKCYKKKTTPKLKVKDLEASSPSKSFMRVFFFF